MFLFAIIIAVTQKLISVLTISLVHDIVRITIVGVYAISVTKFVLQIKTMGDAVTWLGFIFAKRR
jgi:hypothetical protein